MTARRQDLSSVDFRLLLSLAQGAQRTEGASRAVRTLVAADLAVITDGVLAITQTGRAHLARQLNDGSAIDGFRAQHMALAQVEIIGEYGPSLVTADESESPLAWLARRKGRDGTPLISSVQFLAGERLRADFTRAQMMPRVTANWSTSIVQGRRGQSRGAGAMTDAMIAARQRFRHAMKAAGPEFSDILVDVCCFLHVLEDIERRRQWPARSAKVVLQLALDRLARHYGLAVQATGSDRAPVRTWLADDAAFTVETG